MRRTTRGRTDLADRLVAALVLPKLRPYFGLVERVFIATISVFYLVVAIGLVIA